LGLVATVHVIPRRPFNKTRWSKIININKIDNKYNNKYLKIFGIFISEILLERN
jgi:hypothetical protein